MGRTNVIIPFYQRECGLLAVAVKSALAQGGDDLLVTVVDDGSPVRGRDELASIVAQDPRIVIIEQPNAGPAAARNRGLDETPDDVEQIAFLDSDDRWLPGHLANGRAAMRLGANFYFSNYYTYGSDRPRFVPGGKSAPTGVPVPEGADLFFNTGDLIEAVLVGSPIGTSTILFRRSVAPDLRFSTDLYATEDSHFCVGLITASRKVAFSTRCEVAFGFGVNIWASNLNWDSFEALRRAFYMSKFRRAAAANYSLTAAHRRTIAAKLAENREHTAANVLHRLRRAQRIDWPVLARYLKEEPRLLGDLAGVAVKWLFQSLRTRPSARV
jgi:succinoglycan biosynthesis protein ExoW